MYSVAVWDSFEATHHLTVPEAGPEGVPHDHRYRVEATLHGPELDSRGYLCDIDALEAAMAETVTSLRGTTLNDLPELAGKNPSAEHLARVFGNRLLEAVTAPAATSLTIAVEEDDVARVTHERSL